eukprot:jgi/Antlo1/1870/620
MTLALGLTAVSSYLALQSKKRKRKNPCCKKNSLSMCSLRVSFPKTNGLQTSPVACIESRAQT